MDKFEPFAVISYALKNRKVSKILTYLLFRVVCRIVLFQITYTMRFVWTVFAFTLCSGLSPLQLLHWEFLWKSKAASWILFKAICESYCHITQAFILYIAASAQPSLRRGRKLNHLLMYSVFPRNNRKRNPFKTSFIYQLQLLPLNWVF